MRYSEIFDASFKWYLPIYEPDNFVDLFKAHQESNAAAGPRQKSCSEFVGLLPRRPYTQILVPHSYNQSALGCRSIADKVLFL